MSSCLSGAPFRQIFRGSSIFYDRSVSSRLRCSVDQGGRGPQIFALLIRTVVVYYTQVLQVRIEGTELRKGTAKKKWKKSVPSRARKFFVQIALSKAVSFFFFSHPTLLKLHVLGLLIESFPTPYGLCSCVEEKLSFRLNANASRSSSVKILSFSPKSFEGHIFFVLPPILPKLHIWASFMESFKTTYGWWKCVDERLCFTAFLHFCSSRPLP